MTKPPAGASLLFSAISTDASIKKNKNGNFRMEMTGIETINWFTDRPQRAEGTWKPKKLERQWDKYFADSEPNAQTTFRVGGMAGEQGFANFEMFKPKIKCVDRCNSETFAQNNLKFKLKPISKNGKDNLTDLAGKVLIITSLFIDDANTSQASTTWQDELLVGLVQSVGEDHAILSNRYLKKANLVNTDLFGANLAGAYLYDADLTGADLTEASLNGATMTGADLTDVIWYKTICPDGTKNSGSLPCTAEQLIPA